MSDSRELDHLLATLKSFQAKNVTHVKLASLISHVEGLRASSNESITTGKCDADLAMILEKFRADNEVWIASKTNYNEVQNRIFESVITSGQAASKVALTVSGGSCVAMLALLGHLVSSGPGYAALISALVGPLQFFVGAVIAAAAVVGLTFLIQFCFHAGMPVDPIAPTVAEKRWDKAGNVLNVFAMIAWIACIALFAYGAFSAGAILYGAGRIIVP